jgi:hypothetical protein
VTDPSDRCQVCAVGDLEPDDPDFAERREESERWHEFHSLVDEVPPDRVDDPGYSEEGWSIRDLVGHVGAWLAEGGAELERIAAGSHRPGEVDIDAMNARFAELMSEVDYGTARLQMDAARARLLAAWQHLPEVTDDARWWLRKVGSEHYREHLPPLRRFVGNR